MGACHHAAGEEQGQRQLEEAAFHDTDSTRLARMSSPVLEHRYYGVYVSLTINVA